MAVSVYVGHELGRVLCIVHLTTDQSVPFWNDLSSSHHHNPSENKLVLTANSVESNDAWSEG